MSSEHGQAHGRGSSSTSPTAHNKMLLLSLHNTPIFKQLQIEEALLRADDRNWCIINDGSTEAIVLGLSGKPEILVNLNHLKKYPIPLIKRFSGGGTVFVDADTVFVTFICNENFANVPPFPKSIMDWTKSIYQPVFNDINFQLKENDYVNGDRKFGGNAQSIRKKRWLHHSSLLWDFNPKNMEYLQMPPKTPEYRKKRSHNDFLCPLKESFPSRQILRERIIDELKSRFSIQEIPQENTNEILDRPHRRSTTVLKGVVA